MQPVTTHISTPYQNIHLLHSCFIPSVPLPSTCSSTTHSTPPHPTPSPFHPDVDLLFSSLFNQSHTCSPLGSLSSLQGPIFCPQITMFLHLTHHHTTPTITTHPPLHHTHHHITPTTKPHPPSHLTHHDTTPIITPHPSSHHTHHHTTPIITPHPSSHLTHHHTSPTITPPTLFPAHPRLTFHLQPL